jgi:iron complex outermembrane receptor protein
MLPALPGWSRAAQAAEQANENTPVTTLKEVVITAKSISDTDQRRNSTASKMVFGREELDRYGDTSLGDVLKRLPGITMSGTPGRGGDIRMRGLGNGYTQILINGEPAPRGFSMDSLSPDQVERIEIMRAPVAEHSARAIAGTINIVLREDFVLKENDAKPTLGWEQGRLQPSLALQRGSSSANFSYSVSANASHRDLGSSSTTVTMAQDTTTGAPVLAQSESSNSRSFSESLHLGSRLNWKLDGGDKLSLQPFLMESRSHSLGSSQLEQDLGIAPPPYANANWRNDSSYALVRTMGNWNHKIDSTTALELRFNAGLSSSDNKTTRIEADDAGSVVHTSQDSTGIHDASFSTAGKYSHRLDRGRNLALGWEAEFGNRQEDATTIQDGALQLAQYGDSLQARTQRLAAYGQEEWDITPLWSAYAGLRWEGIRTRSAWLGNAFENQSQVMSPLLHSVWRFTEESKDQIRASVTRSYKAPSLSSLVPRPNLSSAYPVSGPNLPASADSVGNPQLKPELAWGLDAAFEHYFSAGGILSASVFQRRIDNLIRNVTSLESVDWSPVPRWVTSPVNIGHAQTRGLELEAKLRLSEVVAEAPALDVRVNVSRFWSRVDGIPGPNNRLDQQPTATANFGLDYRFRVVPLTLGGSLNWTPPFMVQQTTEQSYHQGSKRVLDVYALWRFNSNALLRLSGSNLLHADYDNSSRQIYGNTNHLASTTSSTYPSLAARLELKF